MPVLQKWLNSKPGDYRATFSIYQGVMTGSEVSERLRDSIKAAEWVLFTDATQTPEEVAAICGVTVEKVKVLQGYNDEKPPAPLEIQQIYGLGALGFSASYREKTLLKTVLTSLQERGDLVKEKTAVIDTKARLADLTVDVAAG